MLPMAAGFSGTGAGGGVDEQAAVNRAAADSRGFFIFDLPVSK
jgi:hypothetical protein